MASHQDPAKSPSMELEFARRKPCIDWYSRYPAGRSVERLITPSNRASLNVGWAPERSRVPESSLHRYGDSDAVIRFRRSMLPIAQFAFNVWPGNSNGPSLTVK